MKLARARARVFAYIYVPNRQITAWEFVIDQRHCMLNRVHRWDVRSRSESEHRLLDPHLPVRLHMRSRFLIHPDCHRRRNKKALDFRSSIFNFLSHQSDARTRAYRTHARIPRRHEHAIGLVLVYRFGINNSATERRQKTVHTYIHARRRNTFSLAFDLSANDSSESYFSSCGEGRK